MNLVDRVKSIILTPKTEWPVIAGEPASPAETITTVVLPLAAIPAVATLIGHAVFGGTMMLGVASALVGFCLAIAGVFLTAFVIDFLAPNFGSEKNLSRALQLVAYSWAPGWVAGVLNIIPAIGRLAGILGLYGLYLLYLGLPVMMKTPADKVVVYLVVSIIALVLVYLVIGAILTAVVFGLLGVGAMGSMAF
jgi:hypothetical protein